jgi:hydroxypyruvate isomerase
MNKPAALQEKIGAVSRDLGLDIGPFVMYTSWKAATMVTDDPAVREDLKQKIGKAIDTKKRTGCNYALIAPGLCSQRMEWDYQMANMVDNLRYCVDLAEPAGLIFVIEPLNWWSNHPGLFLQKIPQAFLICRAVNSPYCKIVDDLYHQQITEGNLIPNIDKAWDEIGAFHLGDNPGRKEPTSGEINYKNIFKHLYKKGYNGALCMEHGNSHGKGKEAEKALIAAYRACDSFDV